MANDQEKRIKGKGLFTVPTVEEMTKAADAYRNAAATATFGPKQYSRPSAPKGDRGKVVRGSPKRKADSLPGRVGEVADKLRKKK